MTSVSAYKQQGPYQPQVDLEMTDMSGNEYGNSEHTLPPEFMDQYDQIIDRLKDVDKLSENLSRISA